VKEISECKGNTRIVRRARGSIIHDFYNACERVFQIIAREINGLIPESERWHKKLLAQMAVEIKGIRPALISKKLAAELDEYLAFRHLFRNIYGFELESDRLDRLAEKFPSVARKFEQEIRNFVNKL
jgi:hypothetical protein